jgi:hypothetical protein
VLCALLVDFSAVFLNKSYLERVTHSLASVVRKVRLLWRKRGAKPAGGQRSLRTGRCFTGGEPSGRQPLSAGGGGRLFQSSGSKAQNTC